MSAEAHPSESIPADSETLEAVRAALTPASQPEFWQRRRFQLAALVTLLAVVAAFGVNNFLARQYTPDGAVRQYLSALQSGDAGTAWNQVQVSAPTAPVTATVIDRTALQAALAAGKPDIKSFSITRTTEADATTSIVDFSYDTSSGTGQGKVIVQRSGDTHFGIYPVWHLVLTPTILTLAAPAGTDGVTVDGKPVAIASGAKSTVAVLPLVHKIQFVGTPMLESQTLEVDATFSLGQAVPYQPRLTAAGMDKAKTAIKAYFEGCAKQTSVTPTGCPQSLPNSYVKNGQWQLVGDPTQGLSVGFDQDMNPAGKGHFQMVFAYQESGTTGMIHAASSGAYTTSLVMTSTDVTVTSAGSATGLPGLPRPAATDQAAKDLVAKAFVQCAAVHEASPADCPQGFFFPDASNVTWKLAGDPLSSATVTFDSATGLFTVQGNFDMTITYYVRGYAYSRPSYTSTYKAYLFWDGQALQLVTIDGAI